MGNEVRRVPANWKHPQNEQGAYIPLFDGASFMRKLMNWDDGLVQWQAGYRPDNQGGWKPHDVETWGVTYTRWVEERPDQRDYMPVWSAEVAHHLMMYDCTSEGTPISPAFKTAEELARWLADTGANAFAGRTASYEGWLATIQKGWSWGLVAQNGQTMTGVDFNTLG